MNTGHAAPGYEPRGAAAGRPGAADPDAASEMEAACVAEAGSEADVLCAAEAAGTAEVPRAAEAAAGAGTAAATAAGAHPTTCRAREVLQRVGDKWSVLVIDLLGQGTMRFTELHRAIDGITARMLTVTLRGLERDGIVTRTIHPVIPPRVEYALTPMGRTLLDTIGQLVSWTDSHLPEIEAARAAYDARHPAE
ncbi:MAG TPA: helix-turn-helix domain-containing protein [Streptosporangiaceae bacterium]|nr:helix-turn-helix domain-containing protein [Streptosporangiaceae bacterium]